MANEADAGEARRRVAIACQGGGSHTAFTAGVLNRLLGAEETRGYDVVGISGTSGGAVCAFLAWYALRDGNPGAAGPLLERFWTENSSRGPLQSLLNSWVLWTARLQDLGLVPIVSPYQTVVSTLAARQFKDLLARQVDLSSVAVDFDGQHPLLLLGAVDVLSGEFRAFNSRRDKITVDTVLASAAIPNLFRSVRIEGGTYWDGLFSQNPPVRDLLDTNPDELWVIQINPTTRDNEPRTVAEIADRRNELSGNLSLFQELHLIEKIDGLLESGLMPPGGKYKQIVVRIVELSRSRLPDGQGPTSKLNRDPRFIADLIAHGKEQAEEFLAGLSFERALASRDLDTIVACFDPTAVVTVEPPFGPAATHRETTSLRRFWQAELDQGIRIDLTRKQVARERVTWQMRLSQHEDRPTGEAQASFRNMRITSLRLGPIGHT